MFLMKWIWIPLFAAACSGGNSNPTDGSANDGPTPGDGSVDAAALPPACVNVSGSRLRARYWVTPDGYRQFLGWHDAALGQDCQFHSDPNGMPRCTPESARDAGLAYSDAACTQPIVSISSVTCSTVPPLVWVQDGVVACGAPSHLRPVNSQATVGATVYGKDTVSGSCYGMPSGSDPYYAVGNEVDYTGYVAATLGKASASTRLVLYTYTASDGARQECAPGLEALVAHAYDTTRMEDCYAALAGDGKTHCLPLDKGANTYNFSDAACTNPAVSVPKIACGGSPQASYAWVLPPFSGCPSENRLFAFGPATSTYSNGTGACVAVMQPSPDPYNHYALGAEVPATSFDELTSMANGTGRLLPREYVASDGFRQFRGMFSDQQLGGERCLFDVAADKQIRCVPYQQPSSISSYFKDAACTMPLDLASVRNPMACPVTAPGYATQADFSTCPVVTHVFPVTGPQVTATVYTKSGATCSPQALDTANYAYFILGAELAPASLAAAAPLTE